MAVTTVSEEQVLNALRTVKDPDLHKDLVEAAPKNVLEGVNKEQAQAAKTKLEEAGAKADVK